MIRFEPACLSSVVTKSTAAAAVEVAAQSLPAAAQGSGGNADRDCQRGIPSGLRGLNRRDTTGGM